MDPPRRPLGKLKMGLLLSFFFCCLAWCRSSTAALEGKLGCGGLWIFVCPPPLTSSTTQQRADMSRCWLVPTFLCGPVTTQPLSSVSVSGAFLLNNLFRLTQIAVRGRLTNTRIFRSHRVVLMERHKLLNISCLFFFYLRDVAPNSSVKQQQTATPDTSLLSVKQCSGLCCQALDACQHDPPQTASKKSIVEDFRGFFLFH